MSTPDVLVRVVRTADTRDLRTHPIPSLVFRPSLQLLSWRKGLGTRLPDVLVLPVLNAFYGPTLLCARGKVSRQRGKTACLRPVQACKAVYRDPI